VKAIQRCDDVLCFYSISGLHCACVVVFKKGPPVFCRRARTVLFLKAQFLLHDLKATFFRVPQLIDGNLSFLGRARAGEGGGVHSFTVISFCSVTLRNCKDAIRETHLNGGSELSFTPGTRKFNGEIAKAGEMQGVRGLRSREGCAGGCCSMPFLLQCCREVIDATPACMCHHTTPFFFGVLNRLLTSTSTQPFDCLHAGIVQCH
jgi:hypothetical protein